MTVADAVLAAHTVLAHGAVLAQAKATNDNEVTPGVLGFLVVAGMGVALYFLLKSMSKQLKKIPPAPLDEDADGGEAKPLSPLQAAAARRRAARAEVSGPGSRPS